MNYRHDSLSTIVAAANKIRWEGHELVICGVRHWDALMHHVVDRLGIDDTFECEQGFVDNHGSWWSREDALAIAVKAGQMEHIEGKTQLFSEDLW